MKTVSLIAAVLTSTALLISGCGQKPEEHDKAAEAPTAPAPGGAPGTTVPESSPGTAPMGSAAAGGQTVKGDLLKVEGEFYVLKDEAGKEVRLHVDPTSKIEGGPKAGDKVEAQVTPEGHAMSIKKQ